MANIGALLKAEIARLSKREIRQEVAGIKKASASYRRDIAALKRQVVALERKTTRLAKQTSAAGNRTPPALPDSPVRFGAKGLRALRTRLGLSAAQLALLLGVSEHSVYNCEARKARPRKELLAAIVDMRGIGKREAHQRLDAVKAQRRAKRGKAAPSR